MGHGINKPNAHLKQIDRQSSTNGCQADLGPPQYQPLAISMPGIGLANMELENNNTKNEAVPPLTHLHQSNHSIITGGRQKPARRMGDCSGTTAKRSLPRGPSSHSTRMAAASTALGNSPKASGHRRAPIQQPPPPQFGPLLAKSCRPAKRPRH